MCVCVCKLDYFLINNVLFAIVFAKIKEIAFNVLRWNLVIYEVQKVKCNVYSIVQLASCVIGLFNFFFPEASGICHCWRQDTGLDTPLISFGLANCIFLCPKTQGIVVRTFYSISFHTARIQYNPHILLLDIP